MNHFLAITCASITGITLGITLNHKRNLENPAFVNDQINTHNEQVNSTPHGFEAPFEEVTETIVKEDISTTSTHDSSSTNIDRKLDSILAQQEELKNQQSEYNRELNAIQFRLDSHSASFRPLHSESNTKRIRTDINSTPSLSPLLPPRQ